MKRPLLGCLLAIAVLAGLRWSLGAGAARAVDDAHLQPLLSPDARENFTVAGLTIEGLPQGQRFVYVRKGKAWTCPSMFNAVVLDSEIEPMIAGLGAAFGEVVAGGMNAKAYGFHPGAPLRLLLHGPDMVRDPERDVLLALELGASLPGLGQGRGYVRRVGSASIVELDRDPRTVLERTDALRRLPPFLDQRLLAGEWPKMNEGLRRASIRLSGGVSIDVRSQEIESGPVTERVWVVNEGGLNVTCMPERMAAWQSFLYSVKYRGLADPASAERLGLDEPQAWIQLEQVSGESIELVVGREMQAGVVWVLNQETHMCCLLDKNEAQLLHTVARGLCTSEGENPWAGWLPE